MGFYSMHACDPVPIVMGLRLAALRAAGAPLKHRKSVFYISLLFSNARRVLSHQCNTRLGLLNLLSK